MFLQKNNCGEKIKLKSQIYFFGKNQKIRFFEKNFDLKTNLGFFFFTMSIRNFPKIPKIALRKPSDEPKHAKNENAYFCFAIWNSENQVSETALKSE